MTIARPSRNPGTAAAPERGSALRAVLLAAALALPSLTAHSASLEQLLRLSLEELLRLPVALADAPATAPSRRPR
jgi:hypothetical protein